MLPLEQEREQEQELMHPLEQVLVLVELDPEELEPGKLMLVLK